MFLWKKLLEKKDWSLWNRSPALEKQHIYIFVHSFFPWKYLDCSMFFGSFFYWLLNDFSCFLRLDFGIDFWTAEKQDSRVWRNAPGAQTPPQGYHKWYPTGLPDWSPVPEGNSDQGLGTGARDLTRRSAVGRISLICCFSWLNLIMRLTPWSSLKNHI